MMASFSLSLSSCSCARVSSSCDLPAAATAPQPAATKRSLMLKRHPPFFPFWVLDSSSRTNGSDRGILASSDLSLPNMLAIDFKSNDLCWTDAGLHRIECSSLGDRSRRVVYTPASYPFGLAIQGDLLFWTDWQSNSVERVSLRGGQAVSLRIPVGGNGRVYDIVTVPKECPDVRNACSSENGGCQSPADICLPDGDGGRTCACPDISNATSTATADSCSSLS